MSTKLVLLVIVAFILFVVGIFQLMRILEEEGGGTVAPPTDIDEVREGEAPPLPEVDTSAGGSVTVPEDWSDVTVESAGELTVLVPPDYEKSFEGQGLVTFTLRDEDTGRSIGSLKIRQSEVSSDDLRAAKKRIEARGSIKDGAVIEESALHRLVKVKSSDLGVCLAVTTRLSGGDGGVDVTTECVRDADGREFYFSATLTYEDESQAGELEGEYDIVISSIDLG